MTARTVVGLLEVTSSCHHLLSVCDLGQITSCLLVCKMGMMIILILESYWEDYMRMHVKCLIEDLTHSNIIIIVVIIVVVIVVVIAVIVTVLLLLSN